MPDLKYYVALNEFPHFGTKRMQKLLNYFNTAKQAFDAPLNELLQANIEQKIASAFISFRKKINPDQLMEALEKENIKTITINSDLYPAPLKKIYDPPLLLHYKGEIKNYQANLSLAVVGSRKYTNYGQQVVENLIQNLINNHISIISGLALGLDTLAHTNALQHGGHTIAVLGSGLDKHSIYPAQNLNLAEKIVENSGCLISEFNLGVKPMRHHFPMRNRIISGLSLGTLVIEAGLKSGSLITANCALDQGREVFAVPGNIYSPVSRGTNELIKIGAYPVTTAEDILNVLNIDYTEKQKEKRIDLNEEEQKILSLLTHEPIHTNELVRLSRLDSSLINSTLTIMELKGLVRDVGGMMYVVVK